MTTSGSDYLALSTDQQVDALRPAARDAARQFGLDVATIEVVRHAFNTTFAVDTVDGQRLALRVNTNSTSTPAEVIAQQVWQVAIASDTPVLVPRPIATPEGAWFAEVECAPLARTLLVTASSWLDGPDLDLDLPTLDVVRELGRAMALLHEHAADWTLPAGGEMPTFDTPLFGDDDHLDGSPGLSSEQREVIDRARVETAAAFVRVYDGVPRRALHADLHGGNLKWHEGRLAVFDFDDCGVGVPALDLAISTFYLRGGDPAPEAALREGYADVAPLPDIDPADHEALIAARQLLLANSVLTSNTAELRDEAARYTEVSVDRLRRWLEGGTLTRAMPT